VLDRLVLNLANGEDEIAQPSSRERGRAARRQRPSA
jgi:hypothetical protein